MEESGFPPGVQRGRTRKVRREGDERTLPSRVSTCTSRLSVVLWYSDPVSLPKILYVILLLSFNFILDSHQENEKDQTTL